MLDCVEKSVGRSVERVGKAVGDPLERCWNLPVQRERVSVGIPVRGRI